MSADQADAIIVTLWLLIFGVGMVIGVLLRKDAGS